MSSDEEATIIGRMILERQELIKQGALLSEELGRIGRVLSILGGKLKDIRPPYIDTPLQLTDADHAALDALTIIQLLSEAAAVSKRFHDLVDNLSKVGV